MFIDFQYYLVVVYNYDILLYGIFYKFYFSEIIVLEPLNEPVIAACVGF